MKIEVEVGSQYQLREALAAGVDVIMLDNMSAAEVRESVAMIRMQRPEVIIETSVTLSLETVREIAECGVDLISVGAITQSATAVEISLKTTPL
jgi:nicotinate-nucleotide pyrophosphorylase (carboxylating)